MYRTVNNGQLRKEDVGRDVIMCGWVQKSRDLGGMTFIDLRDRYGITQLVFNTEINPKLCELARQLGREYVVQIKGKVINRTAVNKEMLTGDIEVEVENLKVLNKSKIPPFTIENITDGGDDLRMKYRFLKKYSGWKTYNIYFERLGGGGGEGSGGGELSKYLE